ncbi:MAG: insulinase family protein [Elusimicrobiota bacterium]
MRRQNLGFLLSARVLALCLAPIQATAGTISALPAPGIKTIVGPGPVRTANVPSIPLLPPSRLALSPALFPALTPAPTPAGVSAIPALAATHSDPLETQAAKSGKHFDAAASKPELGETIVPTDSPAAPRTPTLSAPSKKLWAPQPLDAPLPGDPMNVTIHRLSNGMTVYLSPNRQQPRITAHIAVRAGSRNDPADSTGMAHYLEHMLFKGSERLGTVDYAKEKVHLDRITALYEELFKETEPSRRTALYAAIDEENQKASAYAVPNEFDRLYSKLGFTQSNAHTDWEETVYEASFPSNRAETWARTEADRFSRPVFRLFQSELEAVFEEYNKEQDSADMAVFLKSLEETFKGHPYARTVLGLREHLKNPSLAKMYAFYDAWYRPDNMAIVLSGDFERETLLPLLERSFGALRARAPSAPNPPPGQFDDARGARRSEIFFPGEEAAVLAWKTPQDNHPDLDALSILSHILINDRSGIIDRHLSQTQKIKKAQGELLRLNEGGAFLLLVAPKAGQSLEDAEKLVLSEVDRIKAGDFSEQDLRTAITYFEGNKKLNLESDKHRVGTMVDSYIKGRDWRRNVEELQRLRGLSKEDIVRVARAYFGPDRTVVYRRQGEKKPSPIEKPDFTEVKIDPSRASTFAAELAAIPAPEQKPRWLKEGSDYVVKSFDWGKLYWAKNTLSDLFSLQLVIPGGFKADPRLRMAEQLLAASGADNESPAEFERHLARLGTSMGFECLEDECVIEVMGLESNLEESLRLAAARFLRPNIPPDALKNLVDIEIGARQDRRQDPVALGRALGEYAARGAGSAVLADLSAQQLSALRTQDIRALLSGLLRVQRQALYTGTISPEIIASLSTLGNKTWKAAPARAPKRVGTPARPQVVFVHRAGMAQAHIGFLASDGPTDPAEAPIRSLYNAVIGGMDGVIFQEIREARSLAYTSKGELKPGSRAGDDAQLWGWIGTQSDKALEAAALMADILKRTSFEPERFQTALSNVVSSYRSEAVPFREIPERLLDWERAGLGTGDPRPKLLERVLALRPQDLEALGRRLRERTLTIFIVGDRNQIDIEGLRGLGQFREVDPDDIFPR